VLPNQGRPGRAPSLSSKPSPQGEPYALPAVLLMSGIADLQQPGSSRRLVRSRKGLPRAYERASKNATNTNHVCLRCHHVLYLASGSMSPVFCNATRVPEEFCLFVAFLDRRDTQRSHPCSQLRGSRPWTTSTQQSRTESWSRHGEDCRSRGKPSTDCLSSTRLPMTTPPGPVLPGPPERPARHNKSSDLSKREASLGEKHPVLVGRMLSSRTPRALPRE
jgi:hypothetical protein